MVSERAAAADSLVKSEAESVTHAWFYNSHRSHLPGLVEFSPIPLLCYHQRFEIPDNQDRSHPHQAFPPFFNSAWHHHIKSLAVFIQTLFRWVHLLIILTWTVAADTCSRLQSVWKGEEEGLLLLCVDSLWTEGAAYEIWKEKHESNIKTYFFQFCALKL